MLAVLMRYGNQQKSELEKWPVEEVVEFYRQVCKLVNAESKI